MPILPYGSPGVPNPLPINKGGTGSQTQNFVDLTTAQTVGGAKTLTGSLVQNAHSLFGNNASSVDATSVITVNEAYNPVGSNIDNGIKVFLASNGAYTGSMYGLNFSVNTFHSSGTAAYMAGVLGVVAVNTAGNVTTAAGNVSSVQNNSTATLSFGYGLQTGILNQSTGTLTNGYGAYINSAVNNGGGTYANNYGLFIEAQTVGSTLNYAIYTNAGAVRFGDTITGMSAGAKALAIGPNGATNPTFNIDASTASAATGVNIKSAAAGSGVTLSAISSGTNEGLTISTKGTGQLTLNGSQTNINGPTFVFNQNSTGFVVTQGSNSAFNVDTSVSSPGTGFNVKANVAGSGLALSVISSGTNENLTVDAKGTGTITLGSVSTGAIVLPLTRKLNITTGTNAIAGSGTLTAGTVTISTTAVTSSSLIFLTDTSNGANIGSLSVGTKTGGTSFVVNSSNVLDTSTFNWLIIN